VTWWLLLGASLSATVSVDRAPAAVDCPSAEALTAGVEAIVGRPLAESADSRTMQVRVQFFRSEAGYEARLRLTGAREGERVLFDNGPNCAALADAVAVTVALLFDPASESALPPATPRRGPAPRALGAWLSGRLGLGLGLVGAPTWVAGGTIGLSLGERTWLELGGATSGSHAQALGSGLVEVRLHYAELSGFYSLTRGDFQLGPALSVLGGVLRGAGRGYPTTTSASLAYIALGGGARAQFRLGERLCLGARAQFVVPLQKHVLSVGYVGIAYQSSDLSGLVDLGFSYEIW